MSFYDQVVEFARKHKPRTIFEKRYAEQVEFEDKKVWLFPLSRKQGSTLKDTYLYPEISQEIRRSSGKQPTLEELKRLKTVIKATSSGTGYSNIFAIIYFYGSDISPQLVWLVKHQLGHLNVDRWGRAVFFRMGRS